MVGDIDSRTANVADQLRQVVIDDEFDAIRKSYAYKLRGLPTEQRIHADELIGDVLYTVGKFEKKLDK